MKEEIMFYDGYDARAPELRPNGLGNNILGYGSENLFYQGVQHLEAFKGITICNPVTGGRTMFNFSNGYVSLNDYDPGGGVVSGLGSVFISFGKTLWFVGVGKVFWNGADLSATATSTLSFRKLIAGVYTGTTYNAGLTAPSAPTVAARTTGFSGGLTGLLNGVYSVRITKIRSTSGGESVGSAPSAVISVTNGTARVTMPALGANGEDKWGVYCTQAGFGLTGPYFLLQEVADTALTTVDGIPRSVELEWSDGGLLPILVPTDNYPPPSCSHAVQLEDVTLAIGCYGDSASQIGADGSAGSSGTGGNAIALSLAGFPEAYPPDQLLFLPEAPIHVMQRPADRYAYTLMRNAIASLTWTGGSLPVSMEIVWENLGCRQPHHAVNINGRLYAYAGGKLVRMGIGGEPEDDWSDPIQRHVASFNPDNVVVGYDSTLKTFVCMHGQDVYPFHVTDEKWGSPLRMSTFASGNVASCVTVDNHLKLSLNNAGVFSLYDFHVGGGTRWTAWSMWRDGGEPLRKKFCQYIGRVFQHDNLVNPDITTSIYGTNSAGSMDNTVAVKTVVDTLTVLSPVAYIPRPARRWGKLGRAFAVSMSGRSNGGESRPIKVIVDGEISETV